MFTSLAALSMASPVFHRTDRWGLRLSVSAPTSTVPHHDPYDPLEETSKVQIQIPYYSLHRQHYTERVNVKQSSIVEETSSTRYYSISVKKVEDARRKVNEPFVDKISDEDLRTTIQHKYIKIRRYVISSVG